jgi:hypothetical protein
MTGWPRVELGERSVMMMDGVLWLVLPIVLLALLD